MIDRKGIDLERYRAHRYPSQFRTQITIKGQTSFAQIVDVNERGARLMLPCTTQPGDVVSIQVLYSRAQAVVSWVKNGYVGVLFTPSLSMKEVDTLRNAPTSNQSKMCHSMTMREL